MRLLIRTGCIVLGCAIAGSTVCEAQEGEWDIVGPLESETFFESSDVEASGHAPDSENKVTLRLQRQVDDDDWTTISTAHPEVVDEYWEHNFGPLQRGTYRIILFKFGTSVEKDRVEPFYVMGDPE